MSELIERALREADDIALADEPYAVQVIRELVAHNARIRELETVEAQLFASRDALQGAVQRAEKAEAERDAKTEILGKLAGTVIGLGAVIRELEAERDAAKIKHDLVIEAHKITMADLIKCEAERDAARATRIAVIEREIEATRAATIERCATLADQASHDDVVTAGQGRVIGACLEIGHRIRALKPSGETQSEKPVNPYLLGGSSTQSDG